MTYFPKTEYWRPSVTNAKSLDDPTNQYFNKYPSPTVKEGKAEYFPFTHSFHKYSVSLNSQQLMKR